MLVPRDHCFINRFISLANVFGMRTRCDQIKGLERRGIQKKANSANRVDVLMSYENKFVNKKLFFNLWENSLSLIFYNGWKNCWNISCFDSLSADVSLGLFASVTEVSEVSSPILVTLVELIPPTSNPESRRCLALFDAVCASSMFYPLNLPL